MLLPIVYIAGRLIDIDFRVISLEIPTLILIMYFMQPENRSVHYKCFDFLGNISTEMFMCHYLVYKTFEIYLVKYINSGIAFICCLGLSIVLSWIVNRIRKK
jgi:peptidoglycan/LPS O-acetylase OafA/YrhL